MILFIPSLPIYSSHNIPSTTFSPHHRNLSTSSRPFPPTTSPPPLPHRIPLQCATAPEQSSTVDLEKDAETRMKKSIESVCSNFNTIRTGRANPSILDRVMVSYYGAETPLKQLASVGVQGSTTITVETYDQSIVKDVERALMESDIGITPSSDGKLIRLSIPPLSKDRRKELSKKVKALAEEGKVAIRNIRRDVVDKLKKLEKNSDIGKDESMTRQDNVQSTTNKYIKSIDKLAAEKEKEIMTV